MLEKVFKLKQNNTNVKTELIAGVTTFVTMAYILAVNPTILSEAGMDANAVFVATALAAFVATTLMSLVSNLPFALAPGLGLNAYIAYEVCGTMGIPWQVAIFCVFVEAIIFLILTLTKVTGFLFNAIPKDLVKGLTVGIGLFIAFIGFQKGKVVVASEDTLVKIVDFNGSFHTDGISALLCLIGIIVIGILYVRKVKGSILIGVGVSWVLGMIAQVTGLYQVGGEYTSVIPTQFIFNDFETFTESFGACFKIDYSSLNIVDIVSIVFSLLFVDLFNVMGSLLGCTANTSMVDKNGNVRGMQRALVADAVGNAFGSVCGTSTLTIYVESSAGINEGARTGLSTCVTGFLFLVSLIIGPIFIAIPGFAVAPALIFVGFLMAMNVVDINFKNPAESIPAYLCFICMPILYSISDGIGVGIVSYVVINMIAGNAKKIKPLMYILAIVFVMKFALF
ncbi:MAG: NCS2 family permease [Lachnospiraceae bacterium]|nr:NCS2 family permease [Lachnospiraceae bacterium]